MATVYLARDLKHDRHVALKVLDPELGAVLGAERFLAEIKVTANLQHPNLLPLFDSGEAGGLLFYVMPFVEGESLRARLEREKQLPVDEAIRISVAIANALEYAHSHGVIHRDLKPENILMQAGQPVIADFGIALAVSKAGGARITQTGLSLGTPQYMSPEQATGDRVIDGRSDIYSLAAMTYEMLAGEPPHTGTTAQAIIARVLTDRPRPLRSSRSAVPDYVEAAIEHGLEKLPADRFASAREFAESLQGRGALVPTSAAANPRSSAARSWRQRLTDPLTLILGGIALTATATAVIFARRPPAEPPASHAIRFLVAPSDSVQFQSIPIPWPAAISPDGGAIAFRGTRAGHTMLYLQRTDQLEAHPVPGTENGTQPLFSPDGQWLAFEQSLADMKVRLDGSAPVRISAGGSNNGADWTTRNELILGSQGTMHGLARVSVSGGDLVEITHIDSAAGVRDHLWPIATADGKSVVFTVWRGNQAGAELAIAQVDGGGKFTSLGIKAIRPLAILDGALVYLKSDGAVMAVPLDIRRRRTTGDAVSVHDPVFVAPANNGNSNIFVSRGGALVTTLGFAKGQLSWLARDGSVRAIAPDVRGFALPRLSPDGRRIAVNVTDAANGQSDVWLYDLGNSTLSRLTSLESVATLEWTPDGSALFVTTGGSTARSAFWRQPVGGGVAPIKLAEASELSFTATLAPDASALLAAVLHENTWAVTRIPIAPAGAPSMFVDSKGQDWGPRFSPDGKWAALVSDETGRNEVYIRSYPDPSARVQVTDAGGGSPVWSSDGKRLFYHGGTSIIQARLESTPSLRVTARDTLFRNVSEFDAQFGQLANFDLTADASKAVVVQPASASSRLVVSPNWVVEFRRRMGEGRKK